MAQSRHTHMKFVACPVCDGSKTTCNVCFGEHTIPAFAAKYLAPPTSSGVKAAAAYKSIVKLYRDACRVGETYETVEEIFPLTLKMRNFGYNVTPRNTYDWLEGGSTYNVFHRAACDILKIVCDVRDVNNEHAKLLRVLKGK